MNIMQMRRGMGASGAPLPYDAEIEYIQTDGSAYIDTGFKPNQNTTFELTFYTPANFGTRSIWLWGMRNAANLGQLAFLDDSGSNNIQWRFGSLVAQSSPKLAAGKYVFKNTTSPNKLEVGSRTLTTIAQSFTGSFSFFLFTFNVNGTPALSNTGAGIKFYGGKMWDGSTLVRDFIPVRIGQVGYLYDRVGGTFYGNANSTGAFVLGPDVQ